MCVYVLFVGRVEKQQDQMYLTAYEGKDHHFFSPFISFFLLIFIRQQYVYVVAVNILYCLYMSVYTGYLLLLLLYVCKYTQTHTHTRANRLTCDTQLGISNIYIFNTLCGGEGGGREQGHWFLFSLALLNKGIAKRIFKFITAKQLKISINFNA